MDKLIPINRRLRRILSFRHNPSYKEVSDKFWTLAPPPVKANNRPAIYLDNQLERVTAVPTNYQQEYERVTGTWKEFRPTVAYLIKSAHLAEGFVYKGAMKTPLLRKKENWILSGDFERIDHGVLTSTFVSNVYFAHFIQDELPLILAGQKLGESITPVRKLYGHEPEYRDFFQLYSRGIERAKFKELIMVDDISWNDDKVERYETLRSRLRDRMPAANPPGAFFRRGTSGTARLLVNEPEVEEFLAQRGFVILDPQTESATDIMARSLGADIVAGVEGSQMAPGLLSVRDHGTVLTLQPPNRFNNLYKVPADGLEMAYSFVVGQPCEDGFRVDLEELGRTLDLIHAQHAMSRVV